MVPVSQQPAISSPVTVTSRVDCNQVNATSANLRPTGYEDSVKVEAALGDLGELRGRGGAARGGSADQGRMNASGYLSVNRPRMYWAWL